MEQSITIENKRLPCEVVNLFNAKLASEAGGLRGQEQRQRLLGRAAEVATMLDRLDGQLTVDRERAIAMLAEYTGLLELVVEDIRLIRDIDENFGGSAKRPSLLARLALQLEQGIAYLLGMFSVVSSGEELPVYNWRLVERDVQEVHAIAAKIQSQESKSTLKAAA